MVTVSPPLPEYVSSGSRTFDQITGLRVGLWRSAGAAAATGSGRGTRASNASHATAGSNLATATVSAARNRDTAPMAASTSRIDDPPTSWIGRGAAGDYREVDRGARPYPHPVGPPGVRRL